MKKSNFILLIVIAAVALVMSFSVQRHADAALRRNAIALQKQQDEIARTREENQRRTNQVAQAADANNRAADYSTELAQLQAKAAALRSQQSQLSNQLWTIRVTAGERLLASENYDLTNHNGTIRATVAGGPRALLDTRGTPNENSKLNDARAFTAAMQHFADKDQGMFPSSLDQVTSFLPPPLNEKSESWENAPVSGTNDFEIIYQGGTNELANIPLRRIALIRERQPWLTPDGKWARTYGYLDGSADIVTSDDNFQSWDALHIIPPSNP